MTSAFSFLFESYLTQIAGYGFAHERHELNENVQKYFSNFSVFRVFRGQNKFKTVLTGNLGCLKQTNGARIFAESPYSV
jgi:hypothetical protein